MKTLSAITLFVSILVVSAARTQDSKRPLASGPPSLLRGDGGERGSAFVWTDLDLDGREEVLVVHPSGRAVFVREAAGVLEDRTEELGLANLPALSRALWEDVDGDGYPDLLALTRDGSALLLRNERGLALHDVTGASGIVVSGGLVEAAWRDLEGDGLPELLLVTARATRWYRNLGGLVFEESGSAGFPRGDVGTYGTSHGGSAIDATPAENLAAPSPLGNVEQGARRDIRGVSRSAAAAGVGRDGGLEPPAGMSAMTNTNCVSKILDHSGGTCLEASSSPLLGLLYPISSNLFVDAPTGYVGINTTKPGARLDVDAAGDTGLSVRSANVGGSLVELSSPNTNPLTPTLFAKVGDGGTAGFFQERLAVGTLFNGLPAVRATLGLDGSDSPELRMSMAGAETVELVASEAAGNGAQLDLRMANGASTITLDAETGSSAAEVSMFDRQGQETVQIRSESSVEGLGGQLALRRNDGPNAIVMEAQSTEGAEVSMRNAAGIETIKLISEEAPGNGAQLTLSRAAGYPTIVMDAEQGLSSQVSLYNSNAIETIEMVSEEAAGNGAQIILKKYDGTASIILDAEQGTNAQITTETLRITGGSDLVEAFHGGEDCTPGSVMAIDPERPGALALSRTAYDRRVAGVVSGAGGVRHGVEMGQRDVLDGNTLVAISGRVYVNCTSENGPIRPGDLLTSSSTPGSAMRATDPERSFGAVIGKAMGALEGESGLVLILVGLQ